MKFRISSSNRQRLALAKKLEAREKDLEEREFILSQTQKLAKTGSWNFDRKSLRTTWSEEMYNIHGLSKDFDTDDYWSLLNLYDDKSRILILDAVDELYRTRQPFDIVARVITPMGYKKWVRVVGHPVLADGEVSGILGITSDITTSRESEEIVRESEEKFALAFRSNPDLMVITREADLRLMDVNEKIFDILGYTREEVVGKVATDFNFYANPNDSEIFFDQYYATGTAELECPWVRKDGNVVQVIVSSNRLQIRGTFYFITVIKDISARKLAEEKSQKIFELSPDLMLLIELDTYKIIEVNNKLKEITGYERAESLGRATTDFDLWVNQDERKMFFDELSKGRASMVPLLRRKDKSQFHASITASLIHLNGKMHYICAIRDISIYKEAEIRIRQNEANLQAIINNTHMDIWSLDSDLRVIAANDNFKNNVRHLYGVDLQVNAEMTTTFRDILIPEKYEMWLTLYRKVLSGASVSLTQNRNDKIFNFSLHPVNDGSRVIGVVGYANDVTELLRKDEELRLADKRITELQLTTLRAFMNPHFIFNALNSIQYFISNNERENAIGYLSTFSKLIRKVLDSAQAGCISLHDEIEMLNDYVDIERLRFNNEFEMDIKVSPSLNLCAIKVPALLIQPFVENAIIHGFSEPKEQNRIIVSILREGEHLLITVEDNGIGRVAAAKNQRRLLKHKPSSLTINNERLRLINKSDHVSVAYEDLQDVGQSGTRAIIRVAAWAKENSSKTITC